jgi:TIR domain
MTAPIFVSYASKDREAALSLCHALENRGFRCWISIRDIGPGENFQVAIPRAIHDAKVMVLVFSAESNNSNEVKKELALASQNRLIVIPVRVEDVTPDDAFAYELATHQWIDLFEDWENSIQRLSEQLLRVAEVMPQPVAASTTLGTEPAQVHPATPETPRHRIGGVSSAPAGPKPTTSKPLVSFGFNLLVAVYLAPLIVLQILANSEATGRQSDMHYYAALATALLLGYAVWGLLTEKGTMSHRQVDQIDGEASAANLADHVYCVILALFAVVNWYVLYQANRDMTGLRSIATLVWSFMSLIVLILALVQFWNMKSGRLVKLTRKTAPR